MMKIFWSLLFVFSGLSALTTGNLINPYLIEKGIYFSDENWINVRTGVEGFWVYNTRLDSPFEKIQMGGCLFPLVFNIKERVDLYVKVGPTQIQLHSSESKTETTSYKPLCIGGFKVELIEIKDTFLGLDVQCGYFKSDLNKDHVLKKLVAKKINTIFKDWQITGGITQKIGIFYPYLTVACENIKLYLKHYPLDKQTFQSHYRYGPVLGLTIASGNYAFFNLEARFYNLYGIFFESEIRF